MDVGVGQRVRCVAGSDFLVPGHTYTVHEVMPALFPDEPPLIDVHAPSGHLYSLRRFEPINP